MRRERALVGEELMKSGFTNGHLRGLAFGKEPWLVRTTIVHYKIKAAGKRTIKLAFNGDKRLRITEVFEEIAKEKLAYVFFRSEDNPAAAHWVENLSHTCFGAKG
jgi:hypothetical protein